MRAFEVFVNETRLCVAGIGEDGVLTTMVDHVAGNGRDEMHLRVGGLISPTREHVDWKRRRLKTGDEIRVKIVDAASVDRPKRRQRRDSKQELAAQKRYVREMARKLGWELRAKTAMRRQP